MNAPIGWRDSAFRRTRGPPSPAVPNGIRGVRIATPARFAAARRMSSIPTSGASRPRSRSVVVTGRPSERSRCTGRPWDRLEAAGCDRLAAAPARAVRAVVQRAKRGVDPGELAARALAEGEVALLLEDLARRRGLRAVRHLLGVFDRLAELDEQAARSASSVGARQRDRLAGVARDRTPPMEDLPREPAIASAPA